MKSKKFNRPSIWANVMSSIGTAIIMIAMLPVLLLFHIGSTTLEEEKQKK